MGKLSFEDKINLYNDRKSGVSISSLCSKYKILHSNVEYLTRLIAWLWYFKSNNLKVRCVKVELETGEIETLLTKWINLLHLK